MPRAERFYLVVGLARFPIQQQERFRNFASMAHGACARRLAAAMGLVAAMEGHPHRKARQADLSAAAGRARK